MSYYSSKIVTPPSTEPVTLDEAKAHLRIEVAADDSLITDMIKAARELVEKETNLALITQTWGLYMDSWGTQNQSYAGYIETEHWSGLSGYSATPYKQKGIELPKSPIISIDSIKIYADDNSFTTFDSANYYLSNEFPAQVYLKNNVSPPAGTRVKDSIVIQYQAGYGNAGAVPFSLKIAIKQIVAGWYENREAFVVGTISEELPLSVKRILSKFRTLRI